MADILDLLERDFELALRDTGMEEAAGLLFDCIDRIRADSGGLKHHIGKQSRDRRNRFIKSMLAQGKTMEQVAETVGVNKSTVSRINRKRSGFL